MKACSLFRDLNNSLNPLDSKSHSAHCYLIQIGNINDGLVSEYFKSLSPFEQSVSGSIISPTKQFEYIFSRAILREILAWYLQKEPDIAVGEYGKPYLRNGELQFNLSHSNEWLLIGVSHLDPIGVDIEEIKPIPEWRVIEASNPSLFDPHKTPASTLAEFYQNWTKREALLKAHGFGIAASELVAEKCSDSRLTLLQLEVEDSYYMSAIVLNPDATVDCTILVLDHQRLV